MNEIIKEFREKFVVSFEDDPKRDAVDLWGRKEVETLEQFILTKLKEERIKTLEEVDKEIKKLRNNIIERNGPNDTEFTRLAELSLFVEISNLINNIKN